MRKIRLFYWDVKEWISFLKSLHNALSLVTSNFLLLVSFQSCKGGAKIKPFFLRICFFFLFFFLLFCFHFPSVWKKIMAIDQLKRRDKNKYSLCNMCVWTPDLIFIFCSTAQLLLDPLFAIFEF